MAVPRGIVQVDEQIWEIPASYKEGMLVPARIIATAKLLDSMDDGVFEQITNVATLPGIVKYAMCMPRRCQGRHPAPLFRHPNRPRLACLCNP
jgi:tRNA-splicing ligase RtcB